jgi:hypothetical protein
MNRHERRRAAARLSRDRIVRLELLDCHGLIRLIDRQPAFASGIGAALRAMGTAAPPLCGACDAEVRSAAMWGVIRCGERVAITAICGACGTRPDLDLGPAVLAAAGAKAIEPANLHPGRWGTA